MRAVVELLVAGEYDVLERLTGRSRLSADDLRRRVGGYGRTLVRPPDHAYEHLEATDVERASPPRVFVDFDLFTAEEGRSDLTLSLLVIQGEPEWSVVINDLRVQ